MSKKNASRGNFRNSVISILGSARLFGSRMVKMGCFAKLAGQARGNHFNMGSR